MKKTVYLLIIALFYSVTVTAQAGSELINYRTATGDIGSYSITQIRGSAVSANLLALDALSGTGYAIRTGSNTWALRSIALGSTKLSILNADGVSGNTTLDINEGNLSLANIGGTLPVGKLPTGIPNANLANSTINVGGLTLTLGAANTAINFTNLTGSATVAQLPTGIPNANLANASMTINGVPTALGGTRNISLQEAVAVSGTVTGNIISSGQVSVTGGFGLGTETVTATGTDGIPNTTTYCNPGASDITRTLPPTPPFVGYTKRYKRINTTAGNTIIVPNSGQTLNTTAQQAKLVSVDIEVAFVWQGSNVWQVHFN